VHQCDLINRCGSEKPELELPGNEPSQRLEHSKLDSPYSTKPDLPIQYPAKFCARQRAVQKKNRQYQTVAFAAKAVLAGKHSSQNFTRIRDEIRLLDAVFQSRVATTAGSCGRKPAVNS